MHKLPEFTVSQFSAQVKMAVEGAFPYVRIRGEISGYKRAPSGHIYFNLKDENAVLAAICWKGSTTNFSFKPEDGIEIIATGSVTTYPGQSKYQLIIKNIEPAGLGALMALLEKRKEKLAAEGLFAADRKKSLPYLPQIIGIVTSPTGAVIQDIIHRISDRCPTRLIIWPVLVQGDKAAKEISNAIIGFNRLDKNSAVPRPDLLIVARGGGSIEDLWPFNEEIVVRAAADSAIPLISAIGHETDITLIDYAADVRAPTPSAAAEMAVPVKSELILLLQNLHKRSLRGMLGLLDSRYKSLKSLTRALPDPIKFILYKTQRFDNSLMRMATAMHNLLKEKQQNINTLERLIKSYHYQRVLERGFALIRDNQGRIIKTPDLLTPGKLITIELASGTSQAIIASRPDK